MGLSPEFLKEIERRQKAASALRGRRKDQTIEDVQEPEEEPQVEDVVNPAQTPGNEVLSEAGLEQPPAVVSPPEETYLPEKGKLGTAKGQVHRNKEANGLKGKTAK